MKKLHLKRYRFSLVFSAFVLGPVLFITLFGALIAPHDPYLISQDTILKGSSMQYLLGTDEFGRDILSRLLIGISPTMKIAVTSTLFAGGFGIGAGLLAVYKGGLTEFLIMRSGDIMLSFPPILLTLLAVSFWGGGILSLTVTISILYIPHFARVTHAAASQVIGLDYVEAERSAGAGALRIIFKVILPNITSPLMVQASLTMVAAILLESGMSFLGLGIVPPEPSWGQMIGTARNYLAQNPMYAFWPSSCLAATILAINFVGDGLRDILDPVKTVK
ncbi:ABC transporter permease [Agrobacterium tumefaciens]|uniref:ABC transporter permease n=1 Tax=Agrobacterium tumefaciens TaxID=358 RepID=UPI0012B9498D|nr:ABC transporter permease [Agrobacterium tumefaciens]MQB08028.1 ABC transporter permease [Agrobacterium tumefaciens]